MCSNGMQKRNIAFEAVTEIMQRKVRTTKNEKIYSLVSVGRNTK